MYSTTCSMATLKRRFGYTIFLTFLSTSSIFFLLSRSRVGTHLQKIATVTGLDEYSGLWKWAADGEDVVHGGTRMVVFGDSWVDDKPQSGQSGKGKSWARVVCEEIQCVSYLNYAATQPTNAYPANPPTGAMAMNEIYTETLRHSESAFSQMQVDLLPDFGAQVKAFINDEPPTARLCDTIFVLSLGFWDIYNYARLDFELAQNATDATIDEIFYQIDILYTHYVETLAFPHIEQNTNITSPTPMFRVLIPKLLDPSLVPGWLSHRPVPLQPSSIAEQQKNAMYLTDRWNLRLENKVREWMTRKDDDAESPTDPSFEQHSDGAQKTGNNAQQSIKIDKDVFYYDLAQTVVDFMAEYQLQDAGISDSTGLGNGFMPYEYIAEPCLKEFNGDADNIEEFDELNGQLVCRLPEEHLFWDAFNIGSVAKAEIGKQVATMVLEDESLRKLWKLT